MILILIRCAFGVFLYDLYDDERICESRPLEFGSFLLTSDMCVFMS